MKRFGLIGYPLGHSYSKSYFSKKFEELKLKDHAYELFEMDSLTAFSELWSRHPDLVGVNVTVPHKEEVVRFLNEQDVSATRVGAVNVIKKRGSDLIGFNTDYMAFKESLQSWMGPFDGKALILGSGGSSKAVAAALDELKIDGHNVSRSQSRGAYSYHQLKEDPMVIGKFKLLINTTPLGMYPKVDSCPDIPYEYLTEDHYLYDLVYNPEETMFLKKGKANGSKVKNGMEMLRLQAEKSWDIWNE